MKSKFYYLAVILLVSITSINAQDVWSLTGTSAGGWGTDIDLTWNASSSQYEYTGDLLAGELKVRKDHAWDTAWGGSIVSGDNTQAWQEMDGNNITGVASGNYTFIFKTDGTTAQCKFILNAAGGDTDWTNVPVELVGGGVSADNADAVPDANSGWNWGNVLASNNSGMPVVNGSVYTWSWDASILEIDGFKIRIKDYTMPANGNGSVFDAGFSNVNSGASSANIIDEGGNIKNTVKGAYNIILTIDAADGDKKTIVITENSLGFAKVSNAEFKIYPSPIVSSATIEFKINKKSDVNISVFNVVGKLMKSQYLQNQNIGVHKVNFETLGNFPKGIYFVKLNANKSVNVQKVIIE